MQIACLDFPAETEVILSFDPELTVVDVHKPEAPPLFRGDQVKVDWS